MCERGIGFFLAIGFDKKLGLGAVRNAIIKLALSPLKFTISDLKDLYLEDLKYWYDLVKG